MKTYIDSDGVVADFMGWVKSLCPDVENDCEFVDQFVVNNYERCYLDSKPIHENSLFMDLVANHSDYYILTCVGDYHKYMHYFPEKSEEEMKHIFDVLTENKYKWFESYGVPRDKVIVVKRSSEKLEYCKDGAILYDDFDKTVDAWNELGGVGIKVYNNHRDIA